jgi:DNA processing protein
MTPAEAALILNLVEGVGPVSIRRLIDHLGSIEKILDSGESTRRSVEGISPKAARAISEWRTTTSWEQELEEVARLGLRIITSSDPSYPVHLKEIHDPPLVLYVKGAMEDGDRNSIAIVGMRHPSHYGQETARKFGYQLGQIGFSVISGLAMGIDAAAHRGCLQAKGRTVAVLGFGFGYLPKSGNSKIAEEIAESGGAVVTEFPIARAPDRQTFPMRNRIVSGISLGTLVVEAAVKSGALITAHFALEQGRQVFAIPGKIDAPQSQGCHKLIQGGAKLAQCVDDMLEEIQYLIPPERKSGLTTGSPDQPESGARQATRVMNLNATEWKIMENMSRSDEIDIDTLGSLTELPIATISSTLMILEMKRAVRQLPGKRYLRLAEIEKSSLEAAPEKG